jgi:hypothetical protein
LTLFISKEAKPVVGVLLLSIKREGTIRGLISTSQPSANPGFCRELGFFMDGITHWGCKYLLPYSKNVGGRKQMGLVQMPLTEPDREIITTVILLINII